MTDTKHYTGSCLCQSVSYQITTPFITFQYCHCSRCRKVTGSAHASNIIMNPEQFQWLKGEELVGRFEPAEAKNFASCFCKQCGSTLPWMAQSGKAIIIPAGTLDNGPDCLPERNLFWDSRAPWYTFNQQLDAYPTLPGKSEACRLDDH